VSGASRAGVRVLVCGVLPAALLVTTIAVPAALWSRLPDRVADHWTGSGTANDTAPKLVPFLLLGVIVLVGAALIWTGVVVRRSGPRPGPGPRGGTGTLVASGLFMMSIGTASAVMVAVANLGGGSLKSASIGPGGLLGLVGGPLLLTAGATYLLRRYGGFGAAGPSAAAGAGGSAAPSIGLRAGERAVWTGRVRAPWVWALAAVLVAGGAVTQVVAGQWVTATVLIVLGVVLSMFTSVRVTVAARGVSVYYGPLGLRLTRIALRRIASAEVADMSWSHSFGYRGSLFVFGAAAVILRRGPALKLTLRDGKRFLVTVDDADTGAALLNDLLKAQARVLVTAKGLLEPPGRAGPGHLRVHQHRALAGAG
jgi:hypothetical protein